MYSNELIVFMEMCISKRCPTENGITFIRLQSDSSSMAGLNAHQKVADKTYTELLSKEKTSIIVQNNDYYRRKLNGKKYLIIENEEKDMPKKRYRIESIKEGTGSTIEDIYGTTITGPHIKVSLKLREKTK